MGVKGRCPSFQACVIQRPLDFTDARYSPSQAARYTGCAFLHKYVNDTHVCKLRDRYTGRSFFTNHVLFFEDKPLLPWIVPAGEH